MAITFYRSDRERSASPVSRKDGKGGSIQQQRSKDSAKPYI